MSRRRKPSATDPRKAGGSIAGPGGPRDRNSMVLDTTHAVLLDDSTVCLVETDSQGVVLAMQLAGRINKTDDRANVLYLMDEDGAAAIISELTALARRIGPQFHARLMDRIDVLHDVGAVGGPAGDDT